MPDTWVATKFAAAVAAVTLAGTLAACGSSSGSGGTTGTTGGSAGATTAPMHGTADVAYAGSLEKLENTVLGPDFTAASGDHLAGPPGAGSLAIAQGILSGEFSPGVFDSVGAKAIKELWAAHRSSFALGLATDPLVVAYSPSSPDAAELDAIASGTKPLSNLFALMESPGFKLARTDPNQDPQGGFFELMVELAQRQLHLAPGTAQKILGTGAGNSVGNSSQIYSETALEPVIASGSVDAGSAYLSQALQYHLKYIRLPATLNFADPADAALYGTVSITLKDGTPFPGDVITLYTTLVKPPAAHAFSSSDQAADDAYVAFLLSSKGRADLAKAGYVLEPPKLKVAVTGTSAAAVLPAAVLREFHQLGGAMSSS